MAVAGWIPLDAAGVSFHLEKRGDDVFLQLSEVEIARIARFGAPRHYKSGELLFEAGERRAGMFVILRGRVTVSERNGLGRSRLLISQGRGQFLAEVAQLSGQRSLVDGHAENDVEALLVPPEQLRALLVAEADIGDRILRALILRRIGLVESDVSGAMLIGSPGDPDILWVSNFLERNTRITCRRFDGRSGPRDSHAIREVSR
jgi:thioredoxin reductase (NADPH)